MRIPITGDGESTKDTSAVIDDNARKFITKPIRAQFLRDHDATSYTMIVDWLKTGEDNEKKVAYKKFDNGDVKILLISKVTKSGDRTSVKEKITEEKYKEFVASSILHLEKKRYEFTHTQNSIPFSIKYDEFAGDKLCILEVDASSEEARNSFNPNDFAGELTEVTDDIRYYGYRVASMIDTA